ncbi:hypothetical protein NCC49_001018 [Naganishia albida]|nr:hypothetical protein NCC49_001018 [Naganishia albida]
MTLAAEAADRKERLLALRRRKDDGAEHDGSRGSFVFRQRNFDRGTRQPIKAVQSKPAVVADVETVEKRVAGLAERIIAEDAVKRMEELDLLNIAPKRANWDLRRGMDKRMKKLERKTQEAYATLFRQRLLANKSSGASAGTIPSGQDLVASMEAADRDRRREERLVPDAGSGDESDD